MSVCLGGWLAGWLAGWLVGWLVNTITGVKLNRFQPNFVSGHYLSKLSLGLKMGFVAPPLLVPPIQIDKNGRLVVKRDKSRKPFPIATKICQCPLLIKAYDTVGEKNLWPRPFWYLPYKSTYWLLASQRENCRKS